MNLIRIIFLMSFAILAACAANPYYDSSKAHHTQSGFQNVYYKDDKGFWTFLKWKWEQMFKELPEAEDYSFEIDTSKHHLLITNQHKTSLTWIGHATFLIQLNGLNILTDPHFSERASPVSWAGPKRVVPAAMQISDLPEIDAVIISHDHYDSLDVASVMELATHNKHRSIHFLVPLGMKTWFDDLGLKSIEVIELDWGQSYLMSGVKFIAEPSQHWSKRSLFDAYERLWVSWVIEVSDQKSNALKSADQRIFFAGDTGYAQHFKQIGQKYDGFDIALLPIGAYEPRWFMKSHHVNPDEAVQIHMDIKSRYSAAMHWGTFVLTDEPLDEPPLKLRDALQKYQLPETEFEVYKHGETRFF